MDFSTIDIAVFALYALIILSIGLFVSRQKKGETKSAEDYFLAGKSLPWWAIGASLIAANISAEQFIGMSGSGLRLDLRLPPTSGWLPSRYLWLESTFCPFLLKKDCIPFQNLSKNDIAPTLKPYWPFFGSHSLCLST